MKTMKQTLSVLLTALLILSFTSVAFAEVDTEPLQKILLSVKERIGDTSEYTDFRSDSYSNDNESSYYFYWNNDDANLRVTCTADGIITQYSKNDNSYYFDDMHKTLNKPEYSAFYESAEAFMKKLNPDIAEQYVMDSNNNAPILYDQVYSYSFTRYINGIPTQDNAFVSIDPQTEEPTNMSVSYTKAEFEDASSVISPVDAKAAYAQQLGATLRYETDYSKEEAPVVLVYVNDDTAINATTGEIFTVSDNFRMYNGKGDMLSMAEAKDEGFTQVEINEIDEIAGLVSKEKAINAVTSNKYLDLPKSFKTSAELTSYDKKYTYHINLSSDDDDAYATVDAKTGEILSFSSYTYLPLSAKSSSYNESKISTAATNAIKALMPKKFAEYHLADTSAGYQENTTDMSYQRYVNEIPVADNYLNIAIDNESGKVTNFDYMYTDKEFPAPTDIISAEDAMNLMFDNTDFAIKYIYEQADDKTLGKLVYSFDNPYYALDAFTGEPYNQPEEETTHEYTDLDEHYAKESIEKLAEVGISISDEDAFKPDEAIAQKDFLRLAINVASDYVPYFESDEDLYRYAKQYRIIKDDEINADGCVTRIEAAKFLIRAMKAEEYASLEGIYISPYTDVSEYVGYVSLLYGMGIVNGNGNNEYRPNDNITRADAMILIYNYFSKN